MSIGIRIGPRLLALGIVALGWAGCVFVGTTPVTTNSTSHHTAKGFRNVYLSPLRRGFGDLVRWQLGLTPKEIPPVPPDQVPAYVPDVQAPDLELICHPRPDRIQITWIGHSSFLIQAAGLNILTDPVFSRRVSPVPFIGPTRQAPPGLRFEDLPAIDAVVISHNHFDHLDKPTIKRLGRRPRYFIPLGLRAWLAGLGPSRISELDWWQTSYIGNVLFRCVPAQHFSGRGLFSTNRTLWAGWVIEAGPGKIYFAGDSGFCPHFREIGDRLGPFRVALLPIGAYRPWWFMSPMHMDPAEAVRAQRDLGAELGVGMHWGTFRQSEEPLAEPPLYLEKVLKDKGLEPQSFRVMKFGQTLVLEKTR